MAYKGTLSFIPWNDDIGVLHGGRDITVVGGLDVVLVLLHHPVDVPPTLADVPLKATCQPDVRVGLHKNLQIDVSFRVLYLVRPE